MKTRITITINEVLETLKYFNNCHDGILRRISFLKDREVDSNDGSIIYPSNNIEENLLCSIEIEMILNSYKSSKNDQIVLFRFEDVLSFEFSQNNEFDYADIYEIQVSLNKAGFIFTFYSGTKNIKFLELLCRRLKCIEE